MSIKTESIVELNLISCQKCGAPIITVGDNMRVIIPSLTFMCLSCGNQGVFDKIYANTAKFNKSLEMDGQKDGHRST